MLAITHSGPSTNGRRFSFSIHSHGGAFKPHNRRDAGRTIARETNSPGDENSLEKKFLKIEIKFRLRHFIEMNGTTAKNAFIHP
jgi:hypothetical protein